MSLERKIKGMHSVVLVKDPKMFTFILVLVLRPKTTILHKTETSIYKFLTDVTSHKDCRILNKRNHLLSALLWTKTCSKYHVEGKDWRSLEEPELWDMKWSVLEPLALITGGCSAFATEAPAGETLFKKTYWTVIENIHALLNSKLSY